MKNRIDILRELIQDCIITHNEEVLINLIYNLENEYKEIATLITFGEYDENWTHEKLLNYITREI